MSGNIDGAISSVNNKIPISVSARRAATSSAIKGMYPKWITWDELPKYMTDIPWSPSHFTDNHRCAAKLITVQIVAFDFDSGLCTLDQMVDYMKESETPCVIGTTKSHQIDKGEKPPCDRFRVALLMESQTSDNDLYRQQMGFFKKIWATDGVCWFDNACVDSSRYFYPCKNIIYKSHGTPLPWVDKVTPPPRRQVAKYDEKNPQIIPWWVFEKLSNPDCGSARHTTAYAVGAKLGELGWGLEEIVDVVLGTYIAAIGESHVREAVYNGWSKSRGTYSRQEAVAFARGDR